jgi:hypothetical protein
MKKGLVLLTIFMVSALIGCSEKSDFDVPVSDITLYKNYALGEFPPNVTAYNSIILTESNDISSFISNLNKINYKSANNIQFDIWGFTYKIVFDDNDISIISDKYFYLNGELYRITFGNFNYLNDYDWQMFEED